MIEMRLAVVLGFGLGLAGAAAGCGGDAGDAGNAGDDDASARDAALADAAAPDTGQPGPDAATPDAGAPDAFVLQPGCFTGGATPQLDLSGPVVNWTWNDPHVVKVGASYWMYASATNLFQFPVRLYRLVSSDATTWSLNPTTPILDVAADGQWDHGGVETPAAVFWNGQYHLFYTAYAHTIGDPLHSAGEFRVGHAVSSDGVSFTRSAGPLLAPSGSDADASNDWYAFIVAEPAPVVKDGTLYLYFTAVGVDATLATSLQVIGMTSTTDGTAWTPPALALRPDQTLYPRAQDWVGYSTPNAVVLGDQLHLFFDVAHQPAGGEWKQLRVHHAQSADGRTGWVHDPRAIRAVGDFPWAIGELRAPHALVDGNTLRLWLAGHELDGTAPEHFAIGMLTCPLP